DAGVAVDPHRGRLVHAGAVVPHVTVDLDLHVGVETAGDCVGPGGVDDPPAGRAGLAGQVVQTLVQLAQRRLGQIHDLDCLGRAHAGCRSHEYTVAGSGSQMTASSAPGSVAMARYSEAIATQSSVSASTAGLQAMGSRSTANPSAVPTANV